MSESEKKNILGQDLDESQLEKTGGGMADDGVASCRLDAETEKDKEHCERNLYRPHGDCAEVVKAWSWCSKSDACVMEIIGYRECVCASAE